jgi:MoaA/NifB/PqqE/SkfB family radical SAM enzyme
MRSNDDNTQRARTARGTSMHLRLSLARNAPPVPWRWAPSATPDDLSSAEIIQAARGAGTQPGSWLVNDGDPLRRGDLWDLLGELRDLRPADLALCAFGRGVTRAVAQRLRTAGVARVHVPFHCARQDAHDWLVGQPGALKIAHRAIRACLEAGLPVTAEIMLARPTSALLAETVELLARIGVRNVCIRRLTAMDAEGTGFVPLSPRVALLAPHLERAAAVALGRRVRLQLRDLPLCSAPRLSRLFAAPDSERWVLRDGALESRPASETGCPTCPGGRQCAGAPPDYVARFGWEEFADGHAPAVRVPEDVSDQQAARPTEPIAFSWQGPHRVRCDACADATEDWARAAYESTRVIRARMVQAARYRPSLLRLVGADLLAHPQAAQLIYDAVRLFRRVAVAGEASKLVEWSELDLRRVKDLARIDVALYGADAAAHDAHCGMPGAFAAMLRGVEHVRRHTSIPIGAYAILHDARAVPQFLDAWSRGALPGEPRFRLSARGASLDELAECARALPEGTARRAIAALLPRCRNEIDGGSAQADSAPPSEGASRRIEAGRGVPYTPCGSDPLGAFEVCADNAEGCAMSGCPGTAVGWHSAVRSKRWTVNS